MTAKAAHTEAVERPAACGEEAAVRSFVLRFLRTYGIGFRWLANGLLAVSLPPALAAALGSPPEAVWTFDAGSAAPGAQVITHGSHVLDALVHLARARGGAADLICTGPELYHRLCALCSEDPCTPAAGAARAAEEACLFRGVRARTVGRRVLFQDLFVFHFKVAFISDERMEALYAVAADPADELAALVDDARLAGVLAAARGRPALPSRREGERRGGRTLAAEYVVRRLYRLACDQLEAAVQAAAAELAREAEERCRAELAELEAYYRGAAAELADPLRRSLKQLTELKARAVLYAGGAPLPNGAQAVADEALRLERSLRRELDRLEQDRRRRIAELTERYRVRTECELVSVARVSVPRIEWRVRLLGPGRRDVAVLYDVLSGALLGAECEACGRRAAPVTLAADGSVLCAACQTQASSSSG